ncbi:MAG: efflux RND transporter periplasmic adaptor subunit [Sedimentibacter sp.]|uniref:efflux RND transporter periplasmic adaptor subunit n=1 Tax=Sedimentibacter sp. TaxID=1960295 RepID=UPI003159622D
MSKNKSDDKGKDVFNSAVDENKEYPGESGDAVKKNKAFIMRKIRLSNKKGVIFIAAIILVGAVCLTAFGFGRESSSQEGSSYANYAVGKKDITQTLSGTGTLKPADSYTVTTLLSGEILNAPVEEGDVVDKNTILFEIDSSDISINIEQSKLSLSQSQRNYSQKLSSLDDLNAKAGESGTVTELLVDIGDKVTAGQTVARVRNSTAMSLVIPFGTNDAVNLTVGQTAVVTLDSTFEQINGRVEDISAVDERLDGNMLVRYVTIEVQNPGGIYPDQAATAMVGDVACNGSGTFAYKSESTVTAGVSGEVKAIYYEEGDSVSKNQTILALSSDSLETDVANSGDSLQSSELSLENQYRQLEDYTITSPIAGTIIEKNYKTGDTMEAGETLCVIFDLSYLTMTLNVDELDIAKVKVGQQVKVTAEALPGETYEGVVTKVNINGTTSNGTTSYPVEIRIDEKENLLPGMNVQAEIVVASHSNSIVVPVDALSRGNRILVKTNAASQEEGVPAGFEYRQVTTGISDDEYIEITDGLKEGDVIAYMEDSVPETTGFAFPQRGGQETPAGPGGGNLQ